MVEPVLVGVLAGSRRHGMGFQAAARLISRRRVGDRVDPRTVSRLSVSPQWVKNQFHARIKTQQESSGASMTQNFQNQESAAYTGPRMDRAEPSTNGQSILNGQVEGETKPVLNQVDVEDSGAAR